MTLIVAIYAGVLAVLGRFFRLERPEQFPEYPEHDLSLHPLRLVG
jgi:hypothetical protein